MADAAPVLAAPTPADIEAARLRLAGRERFAPGAQLVLLGGRYIGELSDPPPGRGQPSPREPSPPIAVDDPLAALNEALSPSGCTISVARGADIAEPITLLHLAQRSLGPFGLFALRHCA